jgi:hypothetical protein
MRALREVYLGNGNIIHPTQTVYMSTSEGLVVLYVSTNEESENLQAAALRKIKELEEI